MKIACALSENFFTGVATLKLVSPIKFSNIHKREAIKFSKNVQNLKEVAKIQKT